MSQTDEKNKWSYQDQESGSAVVSVSGRNYKTDYSRKIVELIVRRKGVERMPRYLSYREERSPKLFPLFDKLKSEGREISVLEPGCSSGHLSEAILAFPFVTRLVSFDPDEGMIEVCREKKAHFRLDRWEVRCEKTPAFTNEKFDLILLSAMMEHVDPVLRAELVAQCYERLKPGGLFVVMESQNRLWPFEYHVIRLPIPYAHYLPPRLLYRLCKTFGSYREGWSYDEFAHPNTGWWGTSFKELRPSGLFITDVSESYGYGSAWYRKIWSLQGARGLVKRAVYFILEKTGALFGLPPSALTPALYVVFRKEGV